MRPERPGGKGDERMVTVTAVDEGSPAAKARLHAGDKLLSINGREIDDVLDYRFFIPDTRLKLVVETPEGHRRTVRIKKQEFEELGLEFSDYLMDEQRSCRNKCIFCFIDQLPPGMRDSLYFKDDDSRLSFLFGNYITLTNLTEHEVQRIIDMHISPINISVHTTDPALRCKMMNNRFAGDCLKILYRFAEAGLQLQCQLVLVPEYNDGAALDRSLADLAALGDAIVSVAAVPVGLTKYREGLAPIRSFTPEESRAVIAQLTAAGDRMLAERGTRVFYPADEWYINAGLPIPDGDFYEDYPQLENGVGMIAWLRTRFYDALEDFVSDQTVPAAEGRMSRESGGPDALEEYTGGQFVPAVEGRMSRESGGPDVLEEYAGGQFVPAAEGRIYRENGGPDALDEFTEGQTIPVAEGRMSRESGGPDAPEDDLTGGQTISAAAEHAARQIPQGHAVLATGVAAAPFLRELVEAAQRRIPALDAEVIAIRNDFFGEKITVSGLVTGGDLMRQLSGVPMARLLLPRNMLRQEGDCFLDDVTLDEVERTLDVPVTLVPETDGAALFSALIGRAGEQEEG